MNFVISTIATTIALVSLGVSLFNRRQDIKREERYRIRTRVWEVLNGEPGLRTVQALDEDDGNTQTRIELLQRTAAQLKVAGAEPLGHDLEIVLSKRWPGNDEEAVSARNRFLDSVAEFMNPR